MFFGHRPHILRPATNADLGRLGRPRSSPSSSAPSGANAIGVISDRQARLRAGPGAKGVINRKGLQLLGPDAPGRIPRTTPGPRKRASSARRSGTSQARATTSTSCSSIPARSTIPVSCLVVKRGGMVVFCAGTTGYNLTFDARYYWDAPEARAGLALRQPQAAQANKLVRTPHRPLHVGSLLLGRHPQRRTKMMRRTGVPARQHGRAAAVDAGAPAHAAMRLKRATARRPQTDRRSSASSRSSGR